MAEATTPTRRDLIGLLLALMAGSALGVPLAEAAADEPLPPHAFMVTANHGETGEIRCGSIRILDGVPRFFAWNNVVTGTIDPEMFRGLAAAAFAAVVEEGI
jgi:hypothetical protein